MWTSGTVAKARTHINGKVDMDGFIDRHGNKIITLVLVLVAFFAGRFSVPLPEAQEMNTEQKTVTEIRYVPKESSADADVQVTAPKQELTVSVNGKKQKIEKAEGERFVFDKNKLTYTQTSSATIDLRVPDNTRHWSAGIGIGKNGAAGMVRFPLKGNVGGWVAGDRRNILAGIAVNF